MRNTVDGRNHTVDLCTDHLVAYTGVDGIRKIDECRALRQGHHVAFRREHKRFIVEQIDFQGVHKLVRVLCIVLCVNQSGDPGKLAVDLFLALLTGFILPMGSHTVFCNMMHVPRTDLHLKRYAGPSDNGGMERLVHIRFGSGNIVLETAGDALEQLVNNAQRRITFQFVIHDNAESVKIIHLIKALVLIEHLPIDAVYGFNAALKREADIVLFQLLGDIFTDTFQKIAVLAVFLLNIRVHLGITNGIQISQRQILQFLLDTLNTKTVRQGSVHVHCLQCRSTPLMLRLRRKGTHIMKSVAELDKDNTNILGHGQKHLTDVFHLCFFFILDIDVLQFSQTVHQHSYAFAEQAPQDVQIGLIGTILYRVVQKGSTNGIRIKSQ